MLIPRENVKEIKQALYDYPNVSDEWKAVYKAVEGRFEHSPQGGLLRLVYRRGKNRYKVQDELYIRGSTYYAWQEQIITYAAIKACELGIMKI